MHQHFIIYSNNEIWRIWKIIRIENFSDFFFFLFPLLLASIEIGGSWGCSVTTLNNNNQNISHIFFFLNRFWHFSKLFSFRIAKHCTKKKEIVGESKKKKTKRTNLVCFQEVESGRIWPWSIDGIKFNSKITEKENLCETLTNSLETKHNNKIKSKKKVYAKTPSIWKGNEQNSTEKRKKMVYKNCNHQRWAKLMHWISCLTPSAE